MQVNERIIVALDVQRREDFERLSSNLKGTAKYVKVGMELFYSYGPNIIKVLKEMGYKVFLDLKIHDIPNTAKMATKAITLLGADMINVHAAGGFEMMVAAKFGMQEALKENPKIQKPLLIAVTQLTSTDATTLKNDLLINNSLEETVVHYASLAQKAGLDGVVSSPLEVKIIKERLGSNFLCITPGIRPAQKTNDDQKRVTTPKEALAIGSDYIVIGRAITQSEKPSQAFLEIISSIN